jgi:hypothetical protein
LIPASANCLSRITIVSLRSAIPQLRSTIPSPAPALDALPPSA